jgi:hypothetical protein
MKSKWKIRYLIMTIFFVGCIPAFAKPFAKGPYLGQTPPGSTARVFAPGLICDMRPHQRERHGHFSADGNTFCYKVPGKVYITENTDQGWTTPKHIEGIPANLYSPWSPCLSPDANSIYFTDQHFTRSGRRRTPRSKGWSFHRCIRTSKGWSLPEELGPPFSLAVGGFSVAADNSICFDSVRGGFWIAPFVGNTWSQPIKLPIEMGNLKGHYPGIAPDKSFIVFYSIKAGAQGGTETDLYLTLREADGSWTKPRNMGPRINSGYYEFGARISPDKKYMFFNRSNGWNLNRYTDTADIYWVELKEYLPESYREPEGL